MLELHETQIDIENDAHLENEKYFSIIDMHINPFATNSSKLQMFLLKNYDKMHGDSIDSTVCHQKYLELFFKPHIEQEHHYLCTCILKFEEEEVEKLKRKRNRCG